MLDCPNCGGSGGGDEPATSCIVCNGTGEVPDYENPPEPQDDDYPDWEDCHPHWSPY